MIKRNTAQMATLGLLAVSAGIAVYKERSRIMGAVPGGVF